MPNNITVTAKTGPAVQVTSLLINNVTDIDFQLASKILKVTGDGGIKTFELYGVTTVTYTISSGIATVVVS